MLLGRLVLACALAGILPATATAAASPSPAPSHAPKLKHFGVTGPATGVKRPGDVGGTVDPSGMPTPRRLRPHIDRQHVLVNPLTSTPAATVSP